MKGWKLISVGTNRQVNPGDTVINYYGEPVKIHGGCPPSCLDGDYTGTILTETGETFPSICSCIWERSL